MWGPAPVVAGKTSRFVSRSAPAHSRIPDSTAWFRRQGNPIDRFDSAGGRAIDLEPDSPSTFADTLDAGLDPGASNEAVGDHAQLDAGSSRCALCTAITASTVCGNSTALVGSPLPENATFSLRHLPGLRCMKSPPTISSSLGFPALGEQREIDGRRSAPGEIRYLAIDTGPVAGVVRIEVDADRNTAGASRNDQT